MKMYEKLGIDPTTEEGVAKIMELTCFDIFDETREKAIKNGYSHCENPKMLCSECKAKRLFAEIPTKKMKRGETYTDFMNAYDDYPASTPQNSLYSVEFARWLNEEIEVEDD